MVARPVLGSTAFFSNLAEKPSALDRLALMLLIRCVSLESEVRSEILSLYTIFGFVMLSPFASLRANSAKHLALLFVGGKVQSEILRSAPLRSE